MIAADTLARELGCTLADLEDLDGTLGTLKPEHMIYNMHADVLRVEWAKRNPAPFPVRPDRVAAQTALNNARAEYVEAWRKYSSARLRVRAAVDAGATGAPARRRVQNMLIRRSAELRDVEVRVEAAERALSKVLAS